MEAYFCFQFVTVEIQSFLDETGYSLGPFQYSFCPCYKTALVTVPNVIHWTVDRGSTSLVLYLDTSTAFDTIDLIILLR